MTHEVSAPRDRVEALTHERPRCPYCGSGAAIPNEGVGVQASGPNELRFAMSCLQEGREFDVIYRPSSDSDALEIECPRCGSACDYVDLPVVSPTPSRATAQLGAVVAFCHECDEDVLEAFHIVGAADRGLRR